VEKAKIEIAAPAARNDMKGEREKKIPLLSPFTKGGNLGGEIFWG
jgi:hypothetical protein